MRVYNLALIFLDEEMIDHQYPHLGYCGSAMFAVAVNYSECLDFQLFASAYEKQAAGRPDINNTHDIVLYKPRLVALNE